MLKKISRIYHRILVLVHLSPLSLAEKCRIAFGAAIILILATALYIPYIWMNKLMIKSLLDTERTRAGEVFYRQHLRMQAPVGGPVVLDSSGSPLDPNKSDIQWVRFKMDGEEASRELTMEEKKVIDELKANENSEDILLIERKGKIAYSNYVRLFRANDNCITCHNPQVSSITFSKGEPIGAAIINRPLGSEFSRTGFLNRFWIIIAFLIGVAGAIIAFYVITQRVILSPIRQLRALADNIREGNLDTRSAIKTRDEYQRLSEALNNMLDRLQGSQEKLREANRQLDEKIVELSKRNIELFKANKVKSEFLANVSHELRTPLNAILGFAQILKEKPVLLNQEKGQRYAEHIITSGQALLTMINDLLNLAKIEAGKIELKIEKTTIYQICENVVSVFSEMAVEKNIRLNMNVADGIAAVTTDAGKVRQILYNLMSNAIKFTPQDGLVEMAASMCDEKTVRITVIDSGCGIAETDREKIFDKFSQVDGSITRESSGTGLGLAISKELSVLISATLDFESEVGKGSKFWLDIPVNIPENPNGSEKK